VPVLVDAKSLRRAKLRAPVGVFLLKRAKKVKVAGQRARVAPGLLRAGDRLRARAKVTRAVRVAPYWRTPVRSFKLTRRSSTFGPAELQAQLGAFGGDLQRFQSALTGLSNYVQAGLAKQAGDTEALRGQLGSLSTALQALEQRVAALEAGLPALEARMQAQLDALAQQFGSLGTQVAALQGQLAALDGDVTALDGDIAALEAATTDLNADMAAVQTAVGTLCGPTSPLNALC
jgi:septal ring factor EnvC (AmiA/AmiB activator)